MLTDIAEDKFNAVISVVDVSGFTQLRFSFAFVFVFACCAGWARRLRESAWCDRQCAWFPFYRLQLAADLLRHSIFSVTSLLTHNRMPPAPHNPFFSSQLSASGPARRYRGADGVWEAVIMPMRSCVLELTR